MDYFKQGTRIDLRFNTTKGSLQINDMWKLSMNDLTNCIKAVKKTLKETDLDDELSFLDSNKKVDVENELRFAILKDIYTTRKAESDEAATKLADKEHNQKIMKLIAERQEQKLSELSIEELEKLLKK